MKSRTWLAGLMAAAATGAIATAVWAQEHTTVIRQHTETTVPVEPKTRDVTKRTVTVHQTVASRRLVNQRLVRHRRRARTVRAAHLESRTTDTTVTREPVEPATGTMTVDRKTVTHRDEDGDVHRRTKVVRTHPDGSKQVTVRRSVDGPEVDPPAPPQDDTTPH